MSLFVYGMCAKNQFWHFGVDKDPPSRVTEHNIKYARGDIRRVNRHSPHWKLVFVMGPFRTGCNRVASALQKMHNTNKPADPVLLATYVMWYLLVCEGAVISPLYTNEGTGLLHDPDLHEIYCRLVFYYMSRTKPTRQRHPCSSSVHAPRALLK